MSAFIESGMTFGPFPNGHLFRLEDSKTYLSIQEKVKVAEFLLLRTVDGNANPMVWIVEAKRSSPRPESKANFDKFIGEVRDKLANALAIGVASVLKRHPSAAAELPDLFKALDLGAARFRLILVINGHKKEWLPPLQDALKIALFATISAWALGPRSVLVINHEHAKRFGLISAP